MNGTQNTFTPANLTFGKFFSKKEGAVEDIEASANEVTAATCLDEVIYALDELDLVLAFWEAQVRGRIARASDLVDVDNIPMLKNTRVKLGRDCEGWGVVVSG